MQKAIEVVGSKGDLYTVVFDDATGSLSASCTCRAGAFGQLCKHVLTLMGTDEEVHSMVLRDAHLSETLEAYEEAVEIAEKAKKEAAVRKKELTRLLLK